MSSDNISLNHSNTNKKDINEQIKELSLNLNPNISNSNIINLNNNKTPLKEVYNNITSSKKSSKLSPFEEKLSSIKLPNNNIENYYSSLKTENQGIIPQIKRMELLQRKMNLLQNTNEQNSKALKEILEIEMKERLRYPKYTIIQNTPLTPHEEIVNEIIKKKLGPGASYSMNYPTVVFKNQNEIDEMRNIQNSNNNINNNIMNNNRNLYNNNITDNKNNISTKLLKEIQKEILNLRKTVNELKIQLKELKENLKLDLDKDIHKNVLLTEMLRKVIEEGGDNKLKKCVEKYFDGQKINLDEIKTDLDIFKTEELNNIINDEINKYDKSLNEIIEKMRDDIDKIKNGANNNIKDIKEINDIKKKNDLKFFLDNQSDSNRNKKGINSIKSKNDEDNKTNSKKNKSEKSLSKKSHSTNTKKSEIKTNNSKLNSIKEKEYENLNKNDNKEEEKDYDDEEEEEEDDSNGDNKNKEKSNYNKDTKKKKNSKNSKKSSN